jgi:ATP-dependent RNA helicase RhlE
VATPGRLLDLISQGFIDLKFLKIFVLDEADRMLDMGFIHDVKRIITKLPAKRQTLFFSATMPPEIQKLANLLLTNPAKVEVTPASSTVDAIEQSLFYVAKPDKPTLLLHLLKDEKIVTALVFTRTKHGADKVVKFLHRNNITAAAIHGNKSQNARQHALSNFKSGKLRVLVATDIAARGIDIDELSHVFNFELPNIPETYVHRIGRTGRAGNTGIAISFCDAEERAELKDIQKLIGINIPVINEHPYPLSVSILSAPAAPPQKQGPKRSRGFGTYDKSKRRNFNSRRPANNN